MQIFSGRWAESKRSQTGKLTFLTVWLKVATQWPVPKTSCQLEGDTMQRYPPTNQHGLTAGSWKTISLSKGPLNVRFHVVWWEGKPNLQTVELPCCTKRGPSAPLITRGCSEEVQHLPGVADRELLCATHCGGEDPVGGGEGCDLYMHIYIYIFYRGYPFEFTLRDTNSKPFIFAGVP